MSKEMDNPNMKCIDFVSFLNLLVKIAVTLYGGDNVRMAMEYLLDQHVLPLLEDIEKSINKTHNKT